MRDQFENDTIFKYAYVSDGCCFRLGVVSEVVRHRWGRGLSRMGCNAAQALADTSGPSFPFRIQSSPLPAVGGD
jgi:hypothetical protein